MKDEEWLAEATTSETVTTIVTKYGTCKLCGHKNLNDVKLQRFKDIMNNFWVQRKLCGCEYKCKK